MSNIKICLIIWSMWVVTNMEKINQQIYVQIFFHDTVHSIYIYIYMPTCTLFPNALPILHVTVWGSTRATDWTQTIPVDIPLLWAIKAKVIREMVKENIKQFFHSEFFVLGTRMCLAFNIIILGKLTGRGYKIKKGILFF